MSSRVHCLFEDVCISYGTNLIPFGKVFIHLFSFKLCVNRRADGVLYPRCSLPSLPSVAFFPSLKHNFITYRSSKVSSRVDCVFEIHQLWQSGFSRVYSNCCSSCSFEPEIIKIGQSSHKMYINNILNFQGSKTILNACTKKSGNLLYSPPMFIYM